MTTTTPKIQFIQTGSMAINAVVGGKSFVIPANHPRTRQIREALAHDDVNLFLKNANVSDAIKNFSHGAVKIKNGVVLYDERPLHNVITEKILDLMSNDHTFLPMVLFLGRLYGNEAKRFPGNPSSRAIQELFPFLQIKGLPTTEDGFFYAYKRTRDDRTDNWTGTIRSKPGDKVPPMKRNMVDDNWGKDCSQGYHIGSLDFVRGFNMRSGPGGGHIIVVKCDPGHVVSVPREGVQKMRVMWYQPMAEYTDNEEQEGHGLTASPLYRGTSVTPVLHAYNGRSDNDPFSDQPLGGKHITDC